MVYHYHAIHALHERAAISHIKILARLPSMQAVYRITVYRLDAHSRNSIATLFYSNTEQKLEMVYDGLFEQRPLIYTIKREQIEQFMQTLRQVRFDTLADQTQILLKSPVIWAVERAAGNLYHAVLLAPDMPEKPYSTIANAIDSYLPEAIRELAY